MKGLFTKGLKWGGLCLFTLLIPTRTISGPMWPFGDSSPYDTLLNTYGEFQPEFGWYMHGGIDICAPPGTDIFSCGDTNYIRRFKNETAGQDSAYWYIDAGDSSGNMNCTGWSYTHINIWLTRDTIEWLYGDTITHNTLLTRVIKFPNPNRHHLDLSRVYGIANPIDIDPPPQDWVDAYPIENPLDYLPSKADTFKPKFCRFANDRPFLFRPDSIGTGSAFKKNLPSETLWVVSKKIDVLEYISDQTRSNNSSRSVAVDSVLYSIRSFYGSVQGWKGFTFRDAIGFNMNWSPDSLISVKVYCDSGAAYDYIYKPSNTDSLSDYFRSWGTEGWPCFTKITGWWNTKQHKDRAWDNANDAESLAVARFPDGFCWVLGKATDKAGNVAKDSIKVIVNNFPPRVKSTYPESASADVPLNAVLRIVFDQPMDTSITKKALKVKLFGSSDTVAGAKSWNLTLDTLRFTPDTGWVQDTSYTVTLVAASGADSTQDIADSTMAQNYTFPFSTRKSVLLLSWYSLQSGKTYLVRYDTLGTYQVKYDSLSGSYPVTHQRICYDRKGNNYVTHSPGNSPTLHIGKFGYKGDSLGRLLPDSALRMIATDDTSLFFLYSNPSLGDTHIMHSILKYNLQSGSVDSFELQNVHSGWGLAYCPFDNLIYVAADSIQDTTRQYGIIQKYTKGGALSSQHILSFSWMYTDWFITVNDTYLFMYRKIQNDSWNNRIYFRDRTTMNLVDSILPAPHDPRNPDTSNTAMCIVGLVADRSHLYVSMNTTDYELSTIYNWVLVTDRFGDVQRSFGLTSPSDWSFGAIAAYPSILGIPGASSGWGGGIGGGPQAAAENLLLPVVIALGQSYPNPAKNGLKIDYALPKESQVSLKIYNVTGQLVRTLREGKEKPGFYSAEWDGKDQNGHRVSSGVYLYRMEAGEFRKTRKLVVVR